MFQPEVLRSLLQEIFHYFTCSNFTIIFGYDLKQCQNSTEKKFIKYELSSFAYLLVLMQSLLPWSQPRLCLRDWKPEKVLVLLVWRLVILRFNYSVWAFWIGKNVGSKALTLLLNRLRWVLQFAWINRVDLSFLMLISISSHFSVNLECIFL